MLSVLEKFPQVKIVVKQNHPGWSTALALATVENALTRNKNNVQAILANNDGMALGAMQATTAQEALLYRLSRDPSPNVQHAIAVALHQFGH